MENDKKKSNQEMIEIVENAKRNSDSLPKVGGRQKQIEQAADRFSYPDSEGLSFFIEGAEWADSNPETDMVALIMQRSIAFDEARDAKLLLKAEEKRVADLTQLVHEARADINSLCSGVRDQKWRNFALESRASIDKYFNSVERVETQFYLENEGLPNEDEITNMSNALIAARKALVE